MVLVRVGVAGDDVRGRVRLVPGNEQRHPVGAGIGQERRGRSGLRGCRTRRTTTRRGRCRCSGTRSGSARARAAAESQGRPGSPGGAEQQAWRGRPARVHGCTPVWVRHQLTVADDVSDLHAGGSGDRAGRRSTQPFRAPVFAADDLGDADLERGLAGRPPRRRSSRRRSRAHAHGVADGRPEERAPAWRSIAATSLCPARSAASSGDPTPRWLRLRSAPASIRRARRRPGPLRGLDQRRPARRRGQSGRAPRRSSARIGADPAGGRCLQQRRPSAGTPRVRVGALLQAGLQGGDVAAARAR